MSVVVHARWSVVCELCGDLTRLQPDNSAFGAGERAIKHRRAHAARPSYICSTIDDPPFLMEDYEGAAVSLQQQVAAMIVRGLRSESGGAEDVSAEVIALVAETIANNIDKAKRDEMYDSEDVGFNGGLTFAASVARQVIPPKEQQ